MTTATPVFYDCEASDLEGYPIEVGWAFTDLGTGSLVSESHLIQPPAEWPVKESWDRAAERLHGISIVQLWRDGRPVWEVARRMNMTLGGRELFSDAPQDEVWLRLLFDAAGFEPTFTIRRKDARALISQAAADSGLDEAAYATGPRPWPPKWRPGGTVRKPTLAIWRFFGISLCWEIWNHDRGG